MHTVRLGKKDWAVGLWWQTLSNRKTVLKDARSIPDTLSEEHGYDVMVVRSKGIIQAGYGKTPRKMEGMPSLAVACAEAKKSSWIGRFPLPDGVWVIAVSDGIILPDGDFFGTNEEASTALSEIQAIYDCDEFIAPESVEEAEKELESLTRKARAQSRLEAIQPKGPKKSLLIGVIAVLGVSSVVGWHYYAKHEEALKRVAQMKAMRARLAATRKTPTSPWNNLPAPGAVLRACKGSLNQTPLSELGWDIAHWTCSTSGVQIGWKRLDGASFMHLPAHALLNASDPNTAEGTGVALPVLKHRAPQKLFGALAVSSRLYEAARLAGVGIQLQRPHKPAVPAPGAKAPPSPPWMELEWTIKTDKASPFSVFSVADELDPIPGVVTKSLAWNVKDDSWILKGVVYVNR